MVRELKSAIPSIQSNFSRLSIVSHIGEELARLWNQDQLLIIFQGLQIHAKWWAVLASKGISIDAKAFQSSDVELREKCIRGMIPKLLSVLPLSESLDKVIEYCRQFDIEPSYASECYLEYLLVSKASKTDTNGSIKSKDGKDQLSLQSWKGYLLEVLNNKIEYLPAIICIQKLLKRMNPFDHERIFIVCDWLINALTSDDIAGKVSYRFIDFRMRCRQRAVPNKCPISGRYPR